MMILRIIPPTLNSGLSREPLIGRLTSITPLRSFSNATASNTGSFVAVGTLDFFSEGQLVENNLILRVQFAVLHFVFDFERELASLDAVTDILDRVRRHGIELDFSRIGGNVHIEIFGQRVDLTLDIDRGRVVEFRLDRQIAGSVRFELGNRTLYASQVSRVIGLDEKVAEVNIACLQVDLADGNLFLSWTALAQPGFRWFRLLGFLRGACLGFLGRSIFAN